jgi:D-alanyl-D-alanine endopeptidase (penicillin-binding protein 7)
MNEAVLLSITSFVLNAAWQAGIVTLAAFALEGWMRGIAPQPRHWFLLAVCALAVLVPLASADLNIAQPQERGTAGVQESAAPAVGAWTVERARWQVPVAVALQWLAVGLIALGILATAARLLRGLVSLAVIRAGARAAAPARVSRIAELCAVRLNLSRKVRLYVVEGLAGPLTYGAFRPVILIPAQLCRDPDEELLMAVFGHEICHIRRNDFLLNLFCEALLLPLAWHPAAGWIRGRLAATREAACDEIVAELMAGRKRYARSLLRIAAASLETAPGLGLGMRDGGELEHRIRSLLSRPVQGGWRRFAGSAASIVLTAVLASCGMVKAVAPPFKVEPKTLAGDWEGSGMGYQFRVSFTERGKAVAGRVDIARGDDSKPALARFEFKKLGDPPRVIVAPPPPPPPPPPPWVIPDSGQFGNTFPGAGGVAFRIGETNYLITFDAFGDGRLKAMKDGRLPEFNIALRRARPAQ